MGRAHLKISKIGYGRWEKNLMKKQAVSEGTVELQRKRKTCCSVQYEFVQLGTKHDFFVGSKFNFTLGSITRGINCSDGFWKETTNFEDNKMIYVFEGGKHFEIIREFSDDEMITTITVDDIKATKYYKRIPKSEIRETDHAGWWADVFNPACLKTFEMDLDKLTDEDDGKSTGNGKKT